MIAVANYKPTVKSISNTIVFEQVRTVLKKASVQAKTTLSDITVEFLSTDIKATGLRDTELVNGATIAGANIVYNKTGKPNFAVASQTLTITLDGNNYLVNVYKDGRVE